MNKQYEGKTYQVPSGQWAWVILEDDEDVVRGAGYATQEDAIADMYNEFDRVTS